MPTEGRVYQDGLDLVFSPTEEGDSGTYTCVAQNKAGRRTQEVTFTVASESLHQPRSKFWLGRGRRPSELKILGVRRGIGNNVFP